MDPQRLAAADRILEAALDAAPEARAALIASACGGDHDLRSEVESLLRAADAGPSPVDGTIGALLPDLDLAADDDTIADHSTLIGRRLAHYHVLSLIAAGGMGEVYLAEDTRMGRKVALKLLPPRYTRDTDRVARFQREARAASALNHPGILTIHEIGSDAGIHFIASEHIDGQTIRQVVSHGPLSVPDAVDIAAQVAGALASAHAAGLVHRDIKPENVMRRRDGFVKVLDFGLVKLTEQSDHHPGARPGTATRPGAVLGTVNYMSPEQALGREVDERTDLFALGSVLHEMLTGRSPFRAATVALTIAALLDHEPPPLRDARPDVPEDLTLLVSRLLAKDREKRFQTASEVRAALLDVQRGLDTGRTPSGPASAPTVPPRRAPRARRLALGAGLVAALAAAAGIAYVSRTRTVAPRWQEAVVTKLTDRLGAEVFPSLSPDGQAIVYEGRSSSDSDILLQRVGAKRVLHLTEGPDAQDTQPAFSPDGKRIAFRRTLKTGGGIFVMTDTGEALRQLTTFGFNPAWSPDGKRVACTENNVDGAIRTSYPSRLWVVDVEGGHTSELPVGDAVEASWSPSGRRLAYWGVHKGYQRDIFTTSVMGSDTVQVTDDRFVDLAPVWSPTGDSLYFISDRKGTFAVWRVAIDEASGRPTGPPELVSSPASRAHRVSLSADGKRLALGSLSFTQNVERLSFDPEHERITGDPIPITFSSGEVMTPAISPDGTLLAYQLAGPRGDIYVQGIGDPAANLITPAGSSEMSPRWSPDGSRLAYYSNRGGTYQIWTSRPDGSDPVALTNVPPPGAVLPVWSPDGSLLAYSLLGGKSFLISLRRGEESVPHVETPSDTERFSHFVAQSFSPDGRWLSGTGYRRVGRENQHNTGLYLFDIAERRYEKLSDFGTHTRWLSDAKRVLFIHQDSLYLTDIVTKQARRIHSAAPHSLRGLDVSRDGRSIFVAVATTEADVWLLSLD